MLTRRSLLKALGLTAAVGAAGAGLAGCSKGDGGSGSATDTSQVVVAMSPSSEPAAGFDPCIAWGCGEHVHEPLIQSTLITTD